MTRLAAVLAVLVALVSPARAALTDPMAASDVRGRVVDASGGVIVGASVTLRHVQSGQERHAVTDATGAFVFPRIPAGRYVVVALADGFAPAAVDVDPAAAIVVSLTLEPAPLTEQITVTSRLPDIAVSTGTKIAVSPMDLPQTIEAVPQTLLRSQAALSMQDALRNVAGVAPNLGEGRRDQFLIRGFSAQSDTLVDGVRDDAQYYRDLATVERLEVLKGPAAALFGRGSSGGVINRVMKRPQYDRPIGDIALVVGGFGTKRMSFDGGRAVASRRAAIRLAGAWEDSGSFRDFAGVSRVTLAPSFSAFLTPSTSLTVQTEYLHDRRVPDRGIPSVDGQPAAVRISQYYGFPQDDFIRTDVLGATVTAEHQFGNGWLVRDIARKANHATAWSTTQPIDVLKTAGSVLVKRNQYHADQDQQNFFNQVETIGAVRFAGAVHTLLAGVETGVQRRQVVRFNGTAPDVALVDPVLTSPTYSTTAATDNAFTGSVAALYVQDQLAAGERWKALVGLRGDRYDQQLDDRSARNVDLGRVDRRWSPRVGVVFQPTHDISLYSSVSHSFHPSGEGLSLAVNAAELKPESTRNLEGGVKLSLFAGRATTTVSVFRLDRSNIKTTDPLDTTRLVLVGRQRTDGVELTFSGALTPRWSMRASYADLAAAILRSNSVLSGVRIEGNRPGLVPRRSVSVWSTFAMTRALTVGGGLTASGERFTANDNLVRLPAYARADALASYRVGRYELSVNVQNLFDARYFESAGGNFQIYPGAPRSALVTARYSLR